MCVLIIETKHLRAVTHDKGCQPRGDSFKYVLTDLPKASLITAFILLKCINKTETGLEFALQNNYAIQ